MLAWATEKVTVTGAASSAPPFPWGPAPPAGKTSDSVVVGMKGAVAANVNVDGPTWVQVPLTGGSKAGRPAGPAAGADRWTVTTWSEGTSVVPLAGVVDRMVSGAGAPVVDVAPARPAEPTLEECRPAMNAPEPDPDDGEDGGHGDERHLGGGGGEVA